MTDVDMIFDAFAAADAVVQRADAIAMMRQRIVDAKKDVCGSCVSWMRPACKPERQHGHFKSVSAVACKAFKRKQWDENFIRELEGKLQDLLKTKDQP